MKWVAVRGEFHQSRGMNIRDRIKDIAVAAAAWRQELHRHPQTAYEEVFASDFVADKLAGWGIAHERGWAETGIVATIPGKTNDTARRLACARIWMR